MNFPHYIQKAVDLGLLHADGNKIIGCNKDAVETAMGTARLVEKLQPTTTAKMDDTTDQEAIVLCRVLSSPSGVARHLWSELRAAVGVGHGQRFPDYFWSTKVFGAIGYYVDKIFLGDADFETISVTAVISMHTDAVSVNSYNQAPLSELSKTASTLGLKETMNAYGAAKSEWNTALDLLRKSRVKSMYKETLHMANQVTRADSKLEKSIEFLQQRSMECLGLLRGSVGQQGNYHDMTDDFFGSENRIGFMDKILNTDASVQPVSTGILALDIDMEGGVRPEGIGGGRVFTLCGRTGEGKCFGLNTPVIMADGSVRPVQEVLEGDRVLGPDGTPRLVHGLSRGRAPMYRITPVKGDAYTVNDEHILSLRVTGGQKNTIQIDGVRYQGGDIVNIDVRDYLKLSQRKKHLLKGWRSDAVDFHGAPAYKGPLTPYLAGAYLGDGSRHQSRLTLSDNEIIKELRAFCDANGYKLYETDQPGCTGCAISTGLGRGANPVLNWIRENDFVGRGKYIPDSLKRGSIQQRLELLAGLIDTDGHLDNNGYDLVFKEQELANGVAFVARSLGFAAYVSECVKGIKSLDFSGVYYRISISGNLSAIPCRVERKRAKERSQVKNVLNTGIKVEPIGMGDYYGFALEGSDHLFLLGDFTVTHNTQVGVQAAGAAALSGLTVGFVSAELDESSIYARLWSSVTAQTATSEKDMVYSGSIQAPPEGKKKEITDRLSEVAMHLQNCGGKLLVEAPWGADVDAVVSSMRSMKARNPELRLVVLDHFHCLARHKGAPNNEATMLEERAYRLMTAAKELDIDLLVLAQMNRVGMDSLSAKQAPGLDQIRGTDAIAHISHAVWILRREKNDDDNGQRISTGNLELWHSKTRGRQAYWNERTSSVEGIRGFIEKSVIRINHPTSSILKGRQGDDTYSQIHEKTLL